MGVYVDINAQSNTFTFLHAFQTSVNIFNMMMHIVTWNYITMQTFMFRRATINMLEVLANTVALLNMKVCIVMQLYMLCSFCKVEYPQ